MNNIFFKIKKLLEGKYYGFFKSIFKSNGLEFYDIREYNIGDDIRYLNWKLLGKYNKFFINTFIHEKDANFHVFIDINYNFKGGIEKSNFEKLKEFLTDYYIFSRKNNINNIFFYNKKIKKIKTIEDFLFLIKDLEIFVKKTKSYQSLIDRFVNIQKKIRRKRVIIVISDFLQYSGQFDLFKNYEVYLIKVSLPYVGENYIFYKENKKFYIL